MRKNIAMQCHCTFTQTICFPTKNTDNTTKIYWILLQASWDEIHKNFKNNYCNFSEEKIDEKVSFALRKIKSTVGENYIFG